MTNASDRRIAELEVALLTAKSTIEQQQAFIDSLEETPHTVATVAILTEKGRGVIATPGGALECALPGVCAVGNQLLMAGPGAAVKKLDEPLLLGPIVTVERVIGSEAFYQSGDGNLVALHLSFSKVEKGDRVRLDHTGAVALSNLGKDDDGYKTEEVPDVCWADIGGLEAAKEALREAIEYPVQYAELYKAYGQKPSKGVLLHGPPGTGKTMLGKAVANSVGGGGFIYIKGPEVLSQWVGESERTIRQLFARAQEFKKRSGKACVVFIDEADSILGLRGGDRSVGSALSSTLVPAFLAEMDGINDSGAFVLLSTNRPDTLDPAVVRDGRIDRRVYVGRPARPAGEEILRLALKGKLAKDHDTLVSHTAELIYGDRYALFDVQFADSAERFGLRHLVSGAMLTGIVRRATELAIRRDRGTKKQTGLSREDMEAAVTASFHELSHVNHDEAISDYLESVGKQPVAVEKVRHAEA